MNTVAGTPVSSDIAITAWHIFSRREQGQGQVNLRGRRVRGLGRSDKYGTTSDYNNGSCFWQPDMEITCRANRIDA